MKTIISIDLKSLGNEEHLQFHFEVKKLIDILTPKKLNVEALYQAYVSAFYTENSAFQKEQGGVIPQIIIDGNDLRDRAFEEFRLLQKKELTNKDRYAREAAERIGKVLDRYGDVMALNYKDKNAAILRLSSEIKSNYATELNAMGAEPQLKSLNELNEKFIGVYSDHHHDKNTMNSINIRGAREVIDPIFRNIKTRINAQAYVNDDGLQNEFISQINSIINGYQPQLTARKTRIDQRNTKKEKRHLDLSQQGDPSPF